MSDEQEREKFWLRIEYDIRWLNDDDKKRLADIVADGQISEKESEELMRMKLTQARLRRHNIPQSWGKMPGITLPPPEPFGNAGLTFEPYVDPIRRQRIVFASIMIPALVLTIAIAMFVLNF